MNIIRDNDFIIHRSESLLAGFTKAPDVGADRRSELALAAAGAEGETYVIRPKLVHGKYIQNVTHEFLQGKDAYIEVEDCDGLVTDQPNVILTSTHGDCIPVFCWDEGKKVIGLAHAGWKGTKLGIAGELVKAMNENYGVNPKDVQAYIGPGIGRCHFEVRDDVMEQFLSEVPWINDRGNGTANDSTDTYYDINGGGYYHIDLKKINKQFLELAGVKEENIEVSEVCTYCSDEYYSYRQTGTDKRMLAYMVLLK